MCSRSALDRPLMMGGYLDDVTQDGMRWLAAVAIVCGVMATVCGMVALAWAVN